MPVYYVKKTFCVYFLHLLEMDAIAGYCDFTKFLMRNHFILLLYKLPKKTTGLSGFIFQQKKNISFAREHFQEEQS